MTTRAAEYLYILQREFGADLAIEAVNWETEWTTTHYTVAVYLKTQLAKTLQKDKNVKSLQEYVDDGVAAVMEHVIDRDTIDEAVEAFFDDCHNKGLFYNEEKLV